MAKDEPEDRRRHEESTTAVRILLFEEKTAYTHNHKPPLTN